MEAFIILHKGFPLDSMVFTSDKLARNYIKMKNPRRKFEENPENVFTCKRYGSTYKVIELQVKGKLQGEEENFFEEIEKYSDKYQFSFQFWGSGNNNIYIMKDDVDLYDTGGHSTIKDVLVDALHYIYRINRVPNVKRVC